MSNRAHWALAFLLGCVGAVALGTLPLALGALLLVGAFAVSSRRNFAASVSGLLVGFGAMWLVLIAGEASNGGVLDNAVAWAMLGAVPLVIGSILSLAAILGRAGAPAVVEDRSEPRPTNR
jgi:hypothetical protein